MNVKILPYPAKSSLAFIFAIAVCVATFVVKVARNRPRLTGGEWDASEWDGTSFTGGAHPNAFWTVLNVDTPNTRPRPRHKSAFSARTVSDVRDAEAVLLSVPRVINEPISRTHTQTENKNLFFLYLIVCVCVMYY